MGFKILKESENSCRIQATSAEAGAKNESSDGPEFLAAAQKALKNLWLHVTLDVTANPQILGTILPHLLKLHQVITHHRGEILVTGTQGKVSAEILSHLKSAGVTVRVEAATTPFAVTSPLATDAALPPPTVGNVSLTPGQPQFVQALPSPEEIANRFKDLREKVNETLKRRHFLESEKRLYRDRIKSLGVGHDDWHLNQDQIHRLHDAEATLAAEKNRRSGLQKELEQVKEEQLKEENILQKITAEVAADEKKKREVLDKQLTDANKKHDKLKSDYKKKFDTRKERMGRAQK